MFDLKFTKLHIFFEYHHTNIKKLFKFQYFLLSTSEHKQLLKLNRQVAGNYNPGLLCYIRKHFHKFVKISKTFSNFAM